MVYESKQLNINSSYVLCALLYTHKSNKKLDIKLKYYKTDHELFFLAPFVFLQTSQPITGYIKIVIGKKCYIQIFAWFNLPTGSIYHLPHPLPYMCVNGLIVTEWPFVCAFVVYSDCFYKSIYLYIYIASYIYIY